MRCVHVGDRFGLLVAVKLTDKRKRGYSCWLCKCDCGNEVVVSSKRLYYGADQTCLKGVHKPGWTLHPLYFTWLNMIRRCGDPREKTYYLYGACGIRVCDRWLSSFHDFLKDMGPKPSPKHTLDRRKNDGNYNPENCKWATPLEQAANRRKFGAVKHAIRAASNAKAI